MKANKVLVVVCRVLPDELILQILARIPIKSIYKFKSVCKSWYKLLSENYFINLYDKISIGMRKHPMVLIEILDTSGSKPRFLCVGRGVSEINLDFIKDSVRIIGSYDGWLWCSSIPNKSVYYACNPMTRQYKVLPSTSSKETHLRRRPFYPDDGEVRFMGIVCDIIKKTNTTMTALPGRTVMYGYQCLVYDSETCKWNKLTTLRDDHLIRTHIDDGFFNGQLVHLNGSWYRLVEGFVDILFIDLKTKPKSLSWIKLPVKVTNVKGDRAYLLEFDGFLSIVQVAEALLTIWVLKDTQTWEVVEKLSSRRIRPMVPCIYRIFQCGDYMIFATHKKIVIYNRSTRVWTDLFTAKDKCFFQLRFRTRSFRCLLSRRD